MGSCKNFFFIFCFLIFTLDICSAQEISGEAALKWRMALLKQNGLVYESIPFSTAISMTRRDVYRLYLGFDFKGCCYIIEEDDEGKLPFVLRRTVSPGDSITLPGEDRDFKAAEVPGTSRLYVIVSAEPRQNLERLIEQYDRGAVPASLERSLLSEVLAVRRNVSSLPETPEISAPPMEGDPAFRGELYLFEGRDTRVITVTIRN